MSALTPKERSLLEDLKKDEQHCVDKYAKLSADACDQNLSTLFSSIMETEQVHLNTVNSILGGKVPAMNAGGSAAEKNGPPKPQKTKCKGRDKAHDQYLCSDALHTEKLVSGIYNTDIFEFADTKIRDALNHIQKEEQEHGKQIYDYMELNGMYN